VWGNDQGQSFQDVGSLGGNYDDGVSSYYHIIGSDVFRFEVCFQIQNGTSSPFIHSTLGIPIMRPSTRHASPTTSPSLLLSPCSTPRAPACSRGKLEQDDCGAAGSDVTKIWATNGLMSVVWNNALQQSTFASTAGHSRPGRISHSRSINVSTILTRPKISEWTFFTRPR